jgi:hypothetical protein
VRDTSQRGPGSTAENEARGQVRCKQKEYLFNGRKLYWAINSRVTPPEGD